MHRIIKDIQDLASKERALVSQRFFKTGKGEYGEGDVFIGLSVPDARKIAKKYHDLDFNNIQKLLKSKVHEYRLVALLIVVDKYKKGDHKKIFDFYMKNLEFVNNWDLVDLSASKIVGEYLRTRDKGLLYRLSKSKNLWERRVAIISTFQFIYYGDSSETYKLAKLLLSDEHDLIQKAVGWMLREAGKRVSEDELCEFLDKNIRSMPRTTLRYAIERLPEDQRKYYLKL